MRMAATFNPPAPSSAISAIAVALLVPAVVAVVGVLLSARLPKTTTATVASTTAGALG